MGAAFAAAGTVAPLQHVPLGMNLHISDDLPQAVISEISDDLPQAVISEAEFGDTTLLARLPETVRPSRGAVVRLQRLRVPAALRATFTRAAAASPQPRAEQFRRIWLVVS